MLTPDAASSSGGSTLRAVLGQVTAQETHANRQRMAVAFAIAAIAVPAFSLLDFLYSATGPWNLSAILGIRLAVEPLLVAGVVRLRRPSISAREVDAWVDVHVVALTAGMALSVVATGGVDSPYVSGLMLVAAGYAYVPRPFKRSVASAVVSVLVMPVLLVSHALLEPSVADKLLSSRALVTLATHVAIHATTVAVLVMAAHWMWALRRAVFESRSIGRYRARRRIGKGGMGEVWAAWDEGMRREVALKILRSDEPDATSLARFEREVRAMSELTHPNTVRVFDFGTTGDGISYYAMELLEGETLSRLIARDAPMPPSRAVSLVHQAARALAEAHARGIVHRDVKPDNLFVTRAGDEEDFIKVLDFGIARVAHRDIDTGLQLTETGAVAGTPQYLAPELIRGEPVSAAVDVYALGIVLFQLLTGRLPFDAEGPALLFAHVSLEPKRVSEHASVSASLDALVARALAKTAGERFADGREFARALEEVL